MFEASVSPTLSIWASINSWFTPAVFFVVLNLMIGTIAITSRFGNQKHQQAEGEADAEAEAAQEHPQHRQFAGSPSVLQRLKSIRFYAYRSQEPANIFEKSPESESHFDFKQVHEREQPQLTRSPSMLQRLMSINLRRYQSHEPSAPQFPTTAITATATSDLHKTQEFDLHFMTFQEHLDNEEEEQSQEEDEYEYKEQDQYPDQTMNEIYGRLQGTHSTKPSTPQSPTTAITANATPDLHNNQEFDTHATTLQQPLENEEEEDEEESQEEVEYKAQDHYADQTMNEIYDRLQGTHAAMPASEEVPTEPKRKMKKSVSAKWAFPHFEEDDIVEARRPATVSEGKVGATEVKEEVDSKADDFINKFKRQLKLQRMDSILRNMAEDHRRQSGK